MRFTIGRQLATGFSVVVVAVVAVGALALHGVSSGAALTERISGIDNEKHTLALAWERNVAVNGARTYSLLKSDDKAFIDDTRARIDETSKEITRIQTRLVELVSTPEGKAILDEITAKRETYVKARKAMLEKQAQAGNVPSAELAGLTVPLDAYVGAIQKLVDRQSMIFGAAAAEARDNASRSRNVMFAAMAVAIAAIAAVGITLTRRLSRRIGEVRRVVGEVADGNLDVRVRAEGTDEVADLMHHLETMSANLRNLIVTIGGAAGGIKTASSEIAAGSLDLSGRTEAAASNLQQTSASMEQLTQTVRANADSASQANQLARSASEVAARGGDVVGQVVATMEGITESSRRIAEIIGVIDSIAFQTNILALNAAVEAARAGEQGRGFAVVAGEVRNLAQRSAEAASQIKGLITGSVGEVETGSRLVQQAGATMEEIVTSVRRVTDIIGEITSATSEQSAQIGQINAAIGTLDDMTQQNAALVEQSSAAADTMTRQAEDLAASIARFRVGSGGAIGFVPRPAPLASQVPAAAPSARLARPAASAAPVEAPARTPVTPRASASAEPVVRPAPTPRRAAPAAGSASPVTTTVAAESTAAASPAAAPDRPAAARPTMPAPSGPAVAPPPLPMRRSQEPALARSEPDDDWESF